MGIALAAMLTAVAPQQPATDGEWAWVGGDPGARRFSPLAQITPANVGRLQQAWSFDTGALDLQVTPIVVKGVMYFTGGPHVFALDPETGRLLWKFTADGPVSRRGVSYWAGSRGVAPRLFLGAGEGLMVALDAATGAVVEGFGTKGYVDLKASVRGDADGRFSLITPPVIFKDTIVTGGSNTEGEPSTGLYGDIRGWDAHTGALRWSFHTVPRPGEPGIETWEGDSWRNRSGTNAWSYMTVDLERGLVFAPTGSATTDFYGADRKGNNLYANSLVALDAETGKLRWFHQLVHHDIWDWDLPAAPTLIDVT
jgi:quinoprotein glucose dehydrogenase